MARQLRLTAALCALLCALAPLAALAGGTPVGPNVQVTDAGLGEGVANQADVTAQGATFYATWNDGRSLGLNSMRPIYFARSDDGGATWSANARVSLANFRGANERPVISVAPDGSIWIAWWLRECDGERIGCGGEDLLNDVRLAVSTDGGQSFLEYQGYDGNNRARESRMFPEIHAENDRTLLLVANPVSGGADIDLQIVERAGPQTINRTTIAVSEDGGFGRLSNDTFPVGPGMSLAVRGATVCAAWEDRRDRFAIYGACSTNRGDTFGANFRISPGGDDFNPRLAFGPDGTLYATYQDVAGGPIFVRRSADNGASWDEPNVVYDPGNENLAIGLYDVVIDSAGQLLTTIPLRAGQFLPSSGNLYLASSIDRGRSFALLGPLEDGTGETPTVAVQRRPTVAVGSGPNGPRAVVVWSDDRNFADEIWSQRIDLDSAGPTAPANLSAQGGDTAIALSWGAASDASGVAGYHVLRATSAAGPFQQITSQLVTATSYRDVGLDGATYFYQVLAVDSTGNRGVPSNVASAAATVGTGLAGLRGTLAYNQGNSIALRSLDGALGEQRIVGEGENPSFSADGTQILATSGGFALSRPLAGGEARTLFFSPTLLNGLDATNDPSVVGVIEQQFYFPLGGPQCQAFEPRVIDVRSSQSPLYSAESPIATDLSISSDSTLLAYTYKVWCNTAASGVYNTPRLCIVNRATGRQTCLDGQDAGESDFVPNRAQIVFAAAFTGQRELWRADVAANGALSNLVQLTRGPQNQPATAPHVSTDGNWVVFERDTDAGPGESPVLHVVRLDGEGLRSLGVAGRSPAWSGGGSAPTAGPLNNRLYLPLQRR